MASVFINAMVPDRIVLAAQENRRGVTLSILMLSKDAVPTVAAGVLRVTASGWCGDLHGTVALERRVRLEDFTLRPGVPTSPVLVLPGLPLVKTACPASHASMLTIDARFQPGRGARAEPPWNDLFASTRIFRHSAPAAAAAATPGPPPPDLTKPRLPVRDGSPIQRVVTEHMGEVRSCYERQLLLWPELAGKLVVEWVIRPDGRTTDVRLRSSTLRNAPLESCILGAVRTWRFKPSRAPVQVGYPFQLRPAGY